MSLAPALLDVLVCPKSKQPLIYFAPRVMESSAPTGSAGETGFLLSPASRLKYRVERGVPVLLVEEAVEVSPSELDALLKQAKDLGLPGV